MVELKVNGEKFRGWKDVSIKRGIEFLASEFRLGITEDAPDSWPLDEGDECVVSLDYNDIPIPVITGIIDSVDPSYDKNSHSISISGRSKTGQLVDCSEAHSVGTFYNQMPEQLATELCQPFGINVVNQCLNTGGPYNVFSVIHGEQVHECLERISRERKFLLTDNPYGDLVFMNPSKEKILTALIEGQNILAASSQNKLADRFSLMIVKSNNPRDIGVGRADVNDTEILLYRPKVIISETPLDSAACKKRAEWEIYVRAARAMTTTVTIQGWAHDTGLWEPNKIVYLDSPRIRRDGEFLITEVEYTMSKVDGSKTTLTLMPPDAFSSEPPIKIPKLPKIIRHK